jgi:hypothetical protein
MMTTFLLILSKVVFAATIRTPLLRYGERGPERAGRQEPAEALTLPVSPESRFHHDTNASMKSLVKDAPQRPFRFSRRFVDGRPP